MTDAPATNSVEKLATHISGFDQIALGGLPRGRATLVGGPAGSGKTLFAAQFLAAGAAHDQSGVFVTFEESPAAIRRNLASLDGDLPDWEAAGRWAFIDARLQSPEALDELLTLIAEAVRRVAAQRVALDSLNALFSRSEPGVGARRDVVRLVSGLDRLGVTSVLTAEGVDEDSVEAFVVDNVVLLRNTLADEKRRRTIEILKLRGAAHHKGEFPFIVQPGTGMTVSPLSAIQLTQKSSNLRITSGNTELDALCGGGYFRDSVTLVSGATGTGKTLMSTEFIGGGTSVGERCLLLGYEESRDQLFRNAMSWGRDFAAMERMGLLEVSCLYPEAMPLEEHLLQIKRFIDDFGPSRVALDSLSALERVASPRGFREFAIDLSAFLKEREIAGLLTATTPSLLGGFSVTDSHISTIADSIILLRYVELRAEMRRGITLLKMRGSAHDRAIREFTIDDVGMHIGYAFHNLSGILAGNPHEVLAATRDRIPHRHDDEG
ncbi:MAG: circadian clock protein KaiC [Chloroflexi bacterium]|nr:circadian clock protein KaiC [Chloroflexota bacterium]